MPDPPLEYIEITADNVQAGGDTPRGTVVPVSRIGEPAARHLIEAKRAKRCGKDRGAEAVAKEESRG